MNVRRQGPRWETADPGLATLRDLARDFFTGEVLPHQLRWRAERQVDRALWTEAGRRGLLGLSVPKEYGGAGGTLAHDAVLAEEQARVGDTSWGLSAHGIVTQYVLLHGTEEQKRRWLPRLVTGALVGALAVTEPGAGSDLQAITTRACRDGEDYLLKGTKTFVTNGGQANLVITFVVTSPPEERQRRMSLVVVETDGLAGCHRGPVLDKIGRHGQDTGEFTFDDTRVPADNVLGGAEGRGLRQLLPLVSRERLLLAVTSVAAMEAAIEETVRHCRQRTAFGRRLMKFQNTQFVLADCATAAAASRALVDGCVERALAGELSMTDAAMAKLHASETLCEVVDRCLQLFGGYGYLAGQPVARAWADARVSRIFGGTSEIMKEIIAASL